MSQVDHKTAGIIASLINVIEDISGYPQERLEEYYAPSYELIKEAGYVRVGIYGPWQLLGEDL